MSNLDFTLIVCAISFIGGFAFGVVAERNYIFKKLRNAKHQHDKAIANETSRKSS